MKKTMKTGLFSCRISKLGFLIFVLLIESACTSKTESYVEEAPTLGAASSSTSNPTTFKQSNGGLVFESTMTVGFTAQTQNNSTIIVDWADVAKSTNYEVYRRQLSPLVLNDQSCFADEGIIRPEFKLIDTVEDSVYIDTSINPTARYEYQINIQVSDDRPVSEVYATGLEVSIDEAYDLIGQTADSTGTSNVNFELPSLLIEESLTDLQLTNEAPTIEESATSSQEAQQTAELAAQKLDELEGLVVELEAQQLEASVEASELQVAAQVAEEAAAVVVEASISEVDSPVAPDPSPEEVQPATVDQEAEQSAVVAAKQEEADTAAELAAQAAAREEAAAKAAEDVRAAAELALQESLAAEKAAEEAVQQAALAELAAKCALAAEQASAEQAAAEQAAAEQAAAEQAAAEQAAAEQAAAEQAAAEQAAAEQAQQVREGLLAFPGASGYGRFATGGRGGKIVVVDTLEDVVNSGDGKNSLREALEIQSGPRTIVFKVGGVFDTGNEVLTMDGAVDGNVTVACQSAPPPGVIIKGNGITIKGGSTNIIMRHCAIRNIDPGQPLSESSRAIGIVGTRAGVSNMIFDHMSLSWATDENFTVYTSASSTVDSKNFTLSNSIVAEGDADSSHSESGQLPDRYVHAMGPSCNSNSTKYRIEGCSILSNLIAHNGRRNPMFNTSSGEIQHNIIYNWHETAVHGWSNIDLLVANNVFKQGPSSRRDVEVINISGVASRVSVKNNSLEDNHTNEIVKLAESDIGLLTLQTNDAKPVDLDCVGASRPERDQVDDRILLEYETGTGVVGVGNNNERDFRGYQNSKHPESYDTDHDGMQDSWELLHGLNPNNPDDHSGDIDGDGYTNIEEFINELARC